MVLWTSADAVAATGGDCPIHWQATGVSIDTRTLKPGDLFVALKDVRDGHDFVAQALAKGAAAALVSHVPDGLADDAPLLIVADVLEGLQALGAAARARSTARIVAVTGSVGKTSTKEMLRTVLACQGRTHASVASYNNHWGVPLTLARMPADTEFGIFEVGMNHPGEIAPLSHQVRPHVAMITTVAAAHLEAFENIDGIAHEKANIVSGLEPGGAAILPADIDTADILVAAARAKGATLVGFGEKAEAYRLIDLNIVGDQTLVQARLRGNPAALKINSAGRHFASNALGVLAVVEALGADPGRAAIDISRWAPPAGRGRREQVLLDDAEGDVYFELIDDAYNANPTSMGAALEVLAASTPRNGLGRVYRGRRIAILGDMLELGPTSADLHRGVAENLYLQSSDIIHCVGAQMVHLHAALAPDLQGYCVPKADDLIPHLSTMIDAGDVVLVKGSFGSQVSRVVQALRFMHQSP
ncbi:MAG: UDP-N-acetylmuramoyl-tripeptide--D-alanyl-D-alanine ligase [Pseudomonadota bacterium]